MALAGWAALVLAAGGSRRFGGAKLLAGLAGMPVIRRTTEGVIANGFDDVIVVTGQEGAAIGGVLADLPCRIVPAPDWANGMSASIRAGIAACPASRRGVFVFLGDMPFSPAADCRALADLAVSSGYGSRPTHGGRPGHPVCFVAGAFAELAALEGDRGAAGMLPATGGAMAYVETGDIGALLDIDTPADLIIAERLWNARFTSATIDSPMSPGDLPKP